MERIFACQAAEMELSSSRTLKLAARNIALFRTEDGEFLATQDSCTHEQWSLGEDGDLEATEVTCPLHMATFDIRTGAALCLPATAPLLTYEVEVDADNKVYVLIDRNPGL